MDLATPTRKFTSKQMGDACEMLVAAELTLAGVPALKVPDNWPHYDVIAQPAGLPPQRVSVKSRTWKRGPAYLEYNCHDEFDWLCAVILEGERRRWSSSHAMSQTVTPAGIGVSRQRICATSGSIRFLRYSPNGKIISA